MIENIDTRNLKGYEERKQSNLNYALSTSWQLSIANLPSIVYFIQGVTIPSLSVNPIQTQFKNFDLKNPSNKINFSPLNFSFVIDEDFNNYIALMDEFLKQESTNEDRDISDKIYQSEEIKTCLSDITVTKLNSNNHPILRFYFQDCFLSNLGAINYNSTTSEPDILICDAEFNFNRMKIEKVG